jgi:hypothetical protein
MPNRRRRPGQLWSTHWIAVGKEIRLLLQRSFSTGRIGALALHSSAPWTTSKCDHHSFVAVFQLKETSLAALIDPVFLPPLAALAALRKCLYHSW